MSAEEQELRQRLEESGLSIPVILKTLANVATADKSKVFDVTEDGGVKLKRKILPKHAAAIVEVSKGRIRFANPVDALKLAGEFAGLITKGQQAKAQESKQTGAVILPPTLPKAQVFAGLLETDEEIGEE